MPFEMDPNDQVYELPSADDRDIAPIDTPADTRADVPGPTSTKDNFDWGSILNTGIKTGGDLIKVGIDAGTKKSADVPAKVQPDVWTKFNIPVTPTNRPPAAVPAASGNVGPVLAGVGVAVLVLSGAAWALSSSRKSRRSGF